MILKRQYFKNRYVTITEIFQKYKNSKQENKQNKKKTKRKRLFGKLLSKNKVEFFELVE